MDEPSENDNSNESEENLGYEDDFEKDLDWLINEDTESHQGSESHDEDIEAEIDKELQDDETQESSNESKSPIDHSALNNNSPAPMPHSDHQGSVLDSSSDKTLHETELDNLPPPDDDMSDQDEEAKRYIAEKIEMANRLLEHEQPVDDNRERKLKFKEKLIDLEVPPLEFSETDRDNPYSEDDALDRISELHISDVLKANISAHLQHHNTNDENKDGKVLVEKDGKFELMSLRDIESQSFLPKISSAANENEAQLISPRSSHGNGFGSPQSKGEGSSMHSNTNAFPPQKTGLAHLPKPPSNPRGRPSSATHAIKGKRKSPRRVQSADMPQRNSTFSLSPHQKELRLKIEKQKMEQRKEMEARKREEDDQKRRENEMAFKAWLHKKKEQLLEEKRIREAKEMEEMNGREENKDSDEAFHMWLRRKHIDQLRERQIEELKKQDEESDSIHGRAECDHAFRQWLRRKRQQKRAENQAAKELSRRMMMEARRTRQLQNLLYSIAESKPFSLKDQFG